MAGSGRPVIDFGKVVDRMAQYRWHAEGYMTSFADFLQVKGEQALDKLDNLGNVFVSAIGRASAALSSVTGMEQPRAANAFARAASDNRTPTLQPTLMAA